MESVRVECPKGMDVSALRVEGKWWRTWGGSVGHESLRRCKAIVFCICLVAGRSGSCIVYCSRVMHSGAFSRLGL